MLKLINKSNKKKKRKRKKSELNKEIVGIIIISFGILSIISMYNNSVGYVGKIIKSSFFKLAGLGGYFFPYIITAIGILFVLNRLKLSEGKKTVSLLAVFICVLAIFQLNLLGEQNTIDEMKVNELINLSIQYGEKGLGGGLIGGLASIILIKLFGITGSYVVVITLIIISVTFLTNISTIKILKKTSLFLGKIVKTALISIKDFIIVNEDGNNTDKQENKKNETIKIELYNQGETKKENIYEDEIEEKIKILDITKNISNTEGNKVLKESKSENENNDIVTEIKVTSAEGMEKYKFPSLDLLETRLNKSGSDEKKEILNNAVKLEETLRNFGIDSKIIQISKGPTITRYELQPAPGIKVSRIVSLADDIALSLAAPDVRIEAPIPGKSAIGIEVPNRDKANVNLKEILESQEYKELDTKLPFALGKDIAGKPMVANIEKMPHLLIAGATGSGKSVCINTLITSILYKSKPDEVKLLMIDPKVVELSIYNGIPHLLIPVVTDPKKASGALNWAVQEMTNRYKKFAESGVRDIVSYNKKALAKEELEKLPQIVIIIDELADLMMVSPAEVEDSICRLAQMARAAGIHLIVATQRPSVDIITGTIKANIPSRISFAVSSQADSRTILDMGGAEKLLGRGDMLFYPVGASKPMRIQGAFISEKEVEKIVEFLKEQCNNDYEENIINDIEKEVSIDSEDSDELLPEAIKLVVEEGQASISYLQRRLRIGYARAARLIDEMESRGIIGGYEGSKPRKVLVSKEDLDLQ